MHHISTCGCIALIAILFSVKFLPVKSARFLIVTSSDQSCPGEFTGEPCFTLWQYLSGEYITDPTVPRPRDVVLVLLPGIHSWPGSSVPAISNIDSFEMIGEGVASIACPQFVSGFLQVMNVQSVSISGITVTGCASSAILEDIATLTLSSMVFRSNQQVVTLTHVANGTVVNTSFSDQNGALRTHSSTLQVRLSTFNNIRLSGFGCSGGGISSSQSNVMVEECTFTNMQALCGRGYPGSGWGAAMYLERSNTIITDSVFDHNIVRRQGGSIFAIGGSIQLRNTTFSFNSATQITNGGAIYVSGVDSVVIINQTSFINNTAEASGGAVSVVGNNSVVSIHDSYFVNNTAELSHGGALDINGNNSRITVARSDFINNNAGQSDSSGGVMHTRGLRVSFMFTESTFSNNSAAYCGVMNIEDYRHQVTFSECSFTNNGISERSVRNQNGGVACFTRTSIVISNSTFSHNTARSNGGVLSVEGSTIMIQDSTFDHNRAEQDGGVIHSRISPIRPSIVRSSFTNNQAEDGGVIFIGRAGSQVIVRESSFSSNHARQRGGVIHIGGSELSINDSTINNNTALLGGVISACISDITIPEGLTTMVDSTNTVCILYDGDLCVTCTSTTPSVPTQTTTNHITTETTTRQTTPAPVTPSPSTEATPTIATEPTTTADMSTTTSDMHTTDTDTTNDETTTSTNSPTTLAASSDYVTVEITTKTSLSTDTTTATSTTTTDTTDTTGTTTTADTTTTTTTTTSTTTSGVPTTDDTSKTEASHTIAMVTTDLNLDQHTTMSVDASQNDKAVKESEQISDASSIAYAALGVAVVIGILVLILYAIVICLFMYLYSALKLMISTKTSTPVESTRYDSLPMAEKL